MWPTFNKLLSELRVPLRVPLRDYAMRITVFRPDRDEVVIVPPWGLDGRMTLTSVGPREASCLA